MVILAVNLKVQAFEDSMRCLKAEFIFRFADVALVFTKACFCLNISLPITNLCLINDYEVENPPLGVSSIIILVVCVTRDWSRYLFIANLASRLFVLSKAWDHMKEFCNVIARRYSLRSLIFWGIKVAIFCLWIISTVLYRYRTIPITFLVV